jgi:hypothetical protein
LKVALEWDQVDKDEVFQQWGTDLVVWGKKALEVWGFRGRKVDLVQRRLAQ